MSNLKIKPLMNIFMWILYSKYKVKSLINISLIWQLQSEIINEYLFVALICQLQIKPLMNISLIWQLQSEDINEYFYVSLICQILK